MSTTKAEGWWIDDKRLDRWATDVTDGTNNGVVLSDRTGWDDTPPLRGENVTLLGRHGEVWRRKRYGPGRKTLTMSVLGANEAEADPATARLQRAAYEQNLDALMRMFGQAHRVLSVERVHANGDRRQADCEVISPLAPVPVGHGAGRVQVELGIPGAFWEDVDAISYRLPYTVGGAASQDVEVYSLAGQTAPCADAVITVTGPCDAVAIHDAVTGSGFTYSSAIAGDEVLTVDAGAFTALLDATSVITDLVLADQQILEIISAPESYRGPELTVNATSATAGFSVVIEARRKWLR